MSKERKVIVICYECGSDNVTSDASASWDVDTQSWILSDVGEGNYCYNCEHDMGLEEVALEVPDQAGKEIAVMVKAMSVYNENCYSPTFSITSTDDTRYYVHCDEQVNPYAEYRWSVNNDMRLKYYDWRGPIQEGSLVVLRQRNAWQWDVILEEEKEENAKAQAAG